MHKELVVNTPSLSGSSELLVIAPIKPGFVPALDAVTYTSRAKLLLRALHAGRKNAHEYNLFRAVSDAVERVGIIHTLRVAVLEPDESSQAGSILLSVNFDGSYEAYVRTIWQKSSRLLDLIFCNTVGHVAGWDHSYEAWSTWLRSRQIDTPFYYGAPSLTKGDVTALRMQDRFQRRMAETDLLIAQTAIADAEHVAWELIRKDRDPQSGPFAEPASKATPAGKREGARQGLQGLAGVYRLADLYTPVTPDGELLHHAALELLPEFVRMWESGEYRPYILDAAGERLRSALEWLTTPRSLPAVRQKPLLPSTEPPLPPRAQAGILCTVKDAKLACVCLVSFDDPTAAASFLREFMPSAEGTHVPGQPCFNLAVTFEGLRASGVPERVLDCLPIEFRQGMQRRAGVLGDMQANHPRRWALPTLNWPAAIVDPAYVSPANAPVVPLEAVHALLHVRASVTTEAALAADLKARFDKLAPGVRPLSVQWLRRQFRGSEVVDHFGYADGKSDPVFGPDDAFLYPNQVHLGEALLGHANAADAAPAFGAELAPLLRDASYLVVRKMRQDVAAFEAAVKAVPLDPDDVKAKMMGRRLDGTSLMPTVPGRLNDFNYDDDPTGAGCPFAAHVRRANPRLSDGDQANEVKVPPGARPPRLFRRGMSYVDAQAGGGVEKGLFFMAFNARIGEQFEVVQRWLTGGNSSGAPSGAGDPFCGVPEAGRKRFFSFENGKSVVRMALDGDDELGVESPQMVRLMWGEYFLAPSLDGVEHLATLADAAGGGMAASASTPVPWDVADGLAVIAKLRALETGAGADAAMDGWKAALEDPESRREFRTASIWAAIRHSHGGLLRTPYGVLVADGALVRRVLTDVGKQYTVREYQKRLEHTIGPIFLGLDDGPEYVRQASACNAKIMEISFEEGYAHARDFTRQLLDEWTKDADQRAHVYGESRWELDVDIRDVTWKVLARLLKVWFGLSAGKHLTPDGFEWAFNQDGPARYPGAFYTPSRYTFQPQPTESVREVAERDGQHLRQRMTDFLSANDATIVAPVTRAVLDDPGLKDAKESKDYDLAARTISGAIMGFVPTTDNNLRRIVEEWMRDQTVWNLRARASADSLAKPADGKSLLFEPIKRAMMLRPMPEFVWRTALNDHELDTTNGGVFNIHAEDRVVLGLVSVTQQRLEGGARDVVPVFGGDRWATPHAPRHACPGMPAAMGVMAGVLSAIIDTRYALRPNGSTTLLSFEGPVTVSMPPAPPPAPALAKFDVEQKQPTKPAKAKTKTKAKAKVPSELKGAGAELVTATALAAPAVGFAPPASKGVLLGWGDSWFNLDHPLAGKDGWDLPRSLAKLGWNTAGFAPQSTEGLTLEQMAGVQKRKGFYRTVYASLLQAVKPSAILIDGGGNDVHQHSLLTRSPLYDLAAPSGSNPPLNEQAVHAFVHVRLKGYLTTVLTNLVDVTSGQVPVLVHGYDHPIPDGRGFGAWPLIFNWLDPVNDRAVYPTLAEGAKIMQLLIDELNNMIIDAVKPFKNKGVRHMKLTGTLAAQAGYSLTNYDRWWLNELHPTQLGYDALAVVADNAIASALALMPVSPAAPANVALTPTSP